MSDSFIRELEANLDVWFNNRWSFETKAISAAKVSTYKTYYMEARGLIEAVESDKQEMFLIQVVFLPMKDAPRFVLIHFKKKREDFLICDRYYKINLEEARGFWYQLALLGFTYIPNRWS
jgi:hypothetical protein